MPIEFHCSQCELFLRTSDDKAGMRATCPRCDEPITVPSRFSTRPSADVRVESGGQRELAMQRTPAFRGETRPCPMCGATINAVAIRCGEVVRPELASTPTQAYIPDYAGFWERLGAWLIDTAILAVPFVILVGIFIGIMLATGGFDDFDPEGPVPILFQILLAFQVGIAWLYYALMESSKSQATLGKIVLGLQVTNLEGQRIGFGQASRRFIRKVLSRCFCSAGYLLIVFTEKKQALHDLMANSLVVRK